MAWVESSVVAYLRSLLGEIQLHRPGSLPHLGILGTAEIIREAATLLMLFSVGRLAGGTGRSRWAFSFLAFGIWDLFYYVFLIPLTGWPTSLLDWDILFLIPIPWWGPVLAPCCISILLVIGGGTVALFDRRENPLRPGRAAAIAGAAGTALILYSFLATALSAAAQGIQAVEHAVPERFPWPFFLAGCALMAIPVLDVVRRVIRRESSGKALSPGRD